MGAHSPYSSSIDSNNTHSVSSASSSSSSASLCPMHSKAMLRSVEDSSRRDLSTDLRLGLTISSSSGHDLSQREQCVDWPPIKQLLRSSLVNGGRGCLRQQEQSLFVKVYMEGIPIGRKVDLYALDGYGALIRSLSHMFTTTILCPETDGVHSEKYHILTYEDQEGDWMMVGDVPWEMFVSSVKRLKITRGDRC